MIRRKYRLRRDKRDSRDFKYRLPLRLRGVELPEAVDLTPRCPPVLDQGDLGSCGLNAGGSAHQFCQMMRTDHKSFNPSRLQMYYDVRAVEGTLDEDAGVMLRTVVKCMAKIGACPESMWPYNEYNFKKKPSPECYVEAEKNQVLVYMRVKQTLLSVRQCLAEGFPIMVGLQIYSSFESEEVAKTGVVSLPKKGRGFLRWRFGGETRLGGHAVLVVGYDMKTGVFMCRNSWGSKWGKGGYFTIPFEYLLDSDLASDFWTIRLVEEEDRP